MGQQDHAAGVVRRLQALDTVGNCDSVERCETAEAVVAVGTYNLVKCDGGDRRDGSVQIYRVKDGGGDDGDGSGARAALEKSAAIDVPGVFDLKWSPKPLAGCPHALAHAAADGHVGLLSVDIVEGESSGSVAASGDVDNVRVIDRACIDSDSMVLSVDWSTRGDGSSGKSPRIASSTSGGEVCIVDVEEGLRVAERWAAHSLFGAASEAWIVSFDPENVQVLASGGDDCRLKGWDSRAPQTPTFTSKHHGMGVCSIQYSRHQSWRLVTGSYDDTVAIWDKRNMRQPLDTVAVGGGVWRIKEHPDRDDSILVAGMYSGFHLLAESDGEEAEETAVAPERSGEGHSSSDAGEGPSGSASGRERRSGSTEARDSSWSVVASYEEQESIAYGVDWVAPPRTGASNDGDWVIASGSFYDHSLHLWTTT